jgi:hypothetical protein
MKAVLVTTEYRGVFYGLIDEADFDKKEIVLHEPRNVIYWHESIKGFIGLAEIGPNEKCKIGERCTTKMFVHKVTSITECSQKAIEKWNQV